MWSPLWWMRQPAKVSCMQAGCAQLQVLTRQMQLQCAWQAAAPRCMAVHKKMLLRLQARELSKLPGLLRRQPQG